MPFGKRPSMSIICTSMPSKPPAWKCLKIRTNPWSGGRQQHLDSISLEVAFSNWHKLVANGVDIWWSWNSKQYRINPSDLRRCQVLECELPWWMSGASQALAYENPSQSHFKILEVTEHEWTQLELMKPQRPLRLLRTLTSCRCRDFEIDGSFVRFSITTYRFCCRLVQYPFFYYNWYKSNFA